MGSDGGVGLILSEVFWGGGGGGGGVTECMTTEDGDENRVGNWKGIVRV